MVLSTLRSANLRLPRTRCANVGWNFHSFIKEVVDPDYVIDFFRHVRAGSFCRILLKFSRAPPAPSSATRHDAPVRVHRPWLRSLKPVNSASCWPTLRRRTAFAATTRRRQLLDSVPRAKTETRLELARLFQKCSYRKCFKWCYRRDINKAQLTRLGWKFTLLLIAVK